ncbi:YbhB/YbcL family Raf kinase inhibitor-like protein, partial [Marine Group I thaumarchaeote]|nr:YbhB/YbcL family Raf kinase inhibitor-like protein [Marine Group I thaumarchaeote]
MGNLQLTSNAFSHGGEIPRKCGYKNGNEKPPLTINGVPEGTKSLALIMDDPDAMEAVGKVWVHWVVWN